jgi:hypothetical protein
MSIAFSKSQVRNGHQPQDCQCQPDRTAGPGVAADEAIELWMLLFLHKGAFALAQRLGRLFGRNAAENLIVIPFFTVGIGGGAARWRQKLSHVRKLARKLPGQLGDPYHGDIG